MKRRKIGPVNRNLFGNAHGSGKGSVPRSGWTQQYKDNFAEIIFPPALAPDEFRREGAKLTKKYKT